jgi:predicted amidophosphoribosyltransferase
MSADTSSAKVILGCSQCGATLPDGSQFCLQCGKPEGYAKRRFG